MAGPSLRELRFLGRAKADLRAFPSSARETAGRQLLLLQQGHEPADWKPMKSVGSGVNELRIHDQSGAFRVIYIAKLKDAVYVLHCFEKKSQKTSLADLRLATARFKELHGGRPRN